VKSREKPPSSAPRSCRKSERADLHIMKLPRVHPRRLFRNRARVVDDWKRIRIGSSLRSRRAHRCPAVAIVTLLVTPTTTAGSHHPACCEAVASRSTPYRCRRCRYSEFYPQRSGAFRRPPSHLLSVPRTDLSLPSDTSRTERQCANVSSDDTCLSDKRERWKADALNAA